MVKSSDTALAWARVYPALKREITKYLRHGTWYAVVKDEIPDRISVKVGEEVVDVPRKHMEIRNRRPQHFSVISRMDLPPDEHSSPGDLGKRYAVCPMCGGRSALMGEPETRDCPKCGHNGEVGWWEA